MNVFVSATGLSLCTEQRVDFALEMGGLDLTHKGVSFTKQISSPVSVCDAMTSSHTKIKGKGKAVNVLIASATGLYLCPEQEWTLCKRWVAKS